jgi:hypothetical protein
LNNKEDQAAISGEGNRTYQVFRHTILAYDLRGREYPYLEDRLSSRGAAAVLGPMKR